jgi:nucleoside 2-deoxyribosyltransferase
VILGEIRRAQLVIADVTLQRQGVYFEAGFALALGRIVIWACRQDEIARVHFDTRQYSHVVWSDAADLRAKLEARIRATVPIIVKS